MSEWRRSGLTAAEFCRGRDFAVSTLRWYSSTLGEIEEVDESPEPEPVFAKIEVRREHSLRVVVVELEGARVLVPEGADVDTLAVLRALVASPPTETHTTTPRNAGGMSHSPL